MKTAFATKKRQRLEALFLRRCGLALARGKRPPATEIRVIQII